MKRLSLFLLLFALIPTLAFAQDQPSDPVDAPTNIFLAMLQRVPATLDNRSDLYFSDRQIIETAYPDVEIPATFAEFDALQTGERNAWFQAIFNVHTPTARYLLRMATMNSVIGIDYFDIDQELSYGMPPTGALILQGEFDTDAVQNAFSNRNYQPMDDLLWCLAGDCTTGQNTDFQTIDHANPFGGELGRNQPIVIDDNWIASSTTPQQLGYTPTGEPLAFNSLGEMPDVIDAVNAVNSLGILIQASLWDGARIGSFTDMGSLLDPNVDQDALTVDTLEGIARYSLVVLGDVVTDDEQIAVVAFTFDSPESAEASLQEMVNRLETLSSHRGQPFIEAIEQRLATVSTQIIAGDVYSVGLVLFSTPKITYEQLLDPDLSPAEVTAPSLLYNWLISQIIQQDLIWMAYDAAVITSD